jgi:integrase
VKLNSLELRRLRQPGRYGDGQGLFLDVVTRDRRNWVFRYMRQGRERSMGLGSAELVTLAHARDAAHAARKLLAQGIDPIDHRRAQTIAARPRVSFAEAARQYIAAHASGWRSEKHRDQWRSSLAAYVEPIMGNIGVADIDTGTVLRVLQPIWNTKTDTASRVRGRIELVLEYAAARGWRTGANPAIWRGNLRSLLPSRTKVRAVRHHAALNWREAPAFMSDLHKRTGMGNSALMFLILTAARSGEVRGARWSEIDMAHATWTIPAGRMKGAREHRVPLSPPAMEILERLAALRDDSGLVFLGLRHGVAISDMTLTAVLQRMGREDLTVHGFRSMFRDWCADTGKPADVAEAALAHAVANKVIAAYRRTDLFEPRRALMDQWAAYVTKAPAVALPIAATASEQATTRRRRVTRDLLESLGAKVLPTSGKAYTFRPATNFRQAKQPKEAGETPEE